MSTLGESGFWEIVYKDGFRHRYMDALSGQPCCTVPLSQGTLTAICRLFVLWGGMTSHLGLSFMFHGGLMVAHFSTKRVWAKVTYY